MSEALAMYAGRYLLINCVAAGLFLFFSVYIVFVGWVGIRLTGCADLVGGCGGLEAKINNLVRPYGLIFAGVLVLTASIMRIRYIGLSLLWVLALFVWFGASSDFFFQVGNWWLAGVDPLVILRQLPIEALFLMVLCGFLCLPVELYALPQGFMGKLFVSVTGFTASWSFVFSVINSHRLPEIVRDLSGQDWLADGLAGMQSFLHSYTIFGSGGVTPMLLALAVFVATLTMMIVTGRRVVVRRGLRHTVEFH